MPRRGIIESFAAWTALSALRSGAPIKSREDVYPLLRSVDFGTVLEGTAEITADEFSFWHEATIADLCRYEPRLSIGWGVKLINVYLKTAAYVGELGRPGLRAVLHPPIDGGLWRGLARAFRESHPDILQDTHCVTQIQDILTYETYGRIILGCRQAAATLGCLLIEVEQLWEGGPPVRSDLAVPRAAADGGLAMATNPAFSRPAQGSGRLAPRYGRVSRDGLAPIRVLSVDLAHTSYENFGVVLLTEEQTGYVARPLSPRELGLVGRPLPDRTATALAKTCERLGAPILLLDGPQGWKHPDSDLPHSRLCERALNTPGKTGLPGSSKPANYLPFIAFSIAVFERLVAEGFQLWTGAPAPLLAVESFPSSAWRELGVRPLPAKSKSKPNDLQAAATALRTIFPRLDFPDGLSHDELQAVVAALAGVPLLRGRPGGYVAAGTPPYLMDETWREGFIVNPTRDALSHETSRTSVPEVHLNP